MSMTTEGAAMQKPSWFETNITLGNVLSMGTVLVAVSVGYATLSNRVDNLETYRQERSRAVDARLDSIAKSLEALPNLTYRVTANEEALKATNARIDASLQTLSARIAEMNQLLGSLDTKVAVLTQRIEMQTPQRRAEARQAAP